MEDLSMEGAAASLNGARALQARLYREIGVAAVAVALGFGEAALAEQPHGADCEHLTAQAA